MKEGGGGAKLRSTHVAARPAYLQRLLCTLCALVGSLQLSILASQLSREGGQLQRSIGCVC
jgi:hypothetical protein